MNKRNPIVEILATIAWVLMLFWPFTWVGFVRPRRHVTPSQLLNEARPYIRHVNAQQLSDAGDAVLDRLAFHYRHNPRGAISELNRRARQF